MEFTVAWLSMAIVGIITIAFYTYLYKDNPAFRLSEHILLGSFTGHTLLMAVKNIQEQGINKAVGGNIIYIIPLLLGVAFFTRYSSEYSWISRYPLALLVGVTAGVAARAEFQGSILISVQDMISTPLNNLDSIIIFVTLIATMSYFTFTIPHKGVFGSWAKIGQTLLLFSFGASASMEFVSRIGAVSARFEWLINKIPEVTVAGGIVVAAWIVYESYFKTK
jgi:hypothetical protein